MRRRMAVLIVGIAWPACAAGGLVMRILDGATGKPVPARVLVRDERGVDHAPEGDKLTFRALTGSRA